MAVKVPLTVVQLLQHRCCGGYAVSLGLVWQCMLWLLLGCNRLCQSQEGGSTALHMWMRKRSFDCCGTTNTCMQHCCPHLRRPAAAKSTDLRRPCSPPLLPATITGAGKASSGAYKETTSTDPPDIQGVVRVVQLHWL